MIGTPVIPPCSRCETPRSTSSSGRNSFPDGASARVEQALAVARRHTAWWLRRRPDLRGLQEDIFQEAALAAWLALVHLREDLATFPTFAFPRRRTAVRTFLELAAGRLVRRRRWGPGARVAVPVDRLPSPLETDRPCLLTQAASVLMESYRARGLAERDVGLLAQLDLGETLAEAGRQAGVSRQRAHQIRRAATSVRR